MRSPVGKLMLWLSIAGLLTACATSYEPVPPFTPVDIEAGGRALKAQNVLVILDASSSMEEGYHQWKKFDIATATVRNMAQTIPTDMGIKSGLRIFGGDPNRFKESTQLIGKVGHFDEVMFNEALSTVSRTGGTSPLPEAAAAIAQDLDGLTGNTAVIIVSDAKNMDGQPAANASLIKEKFGDAVCFYPVLVGDGPRGKALMQRIAAIGECGFASTADELAGGRQMADFVANVFLGDILDSDGDGVLDINDQCPGTSAGVEVDGNGCPLDSDGDGVSDNLDKCPGTPAGMKVDAKGCPLDSDGDGVPDAQDKCPGTPAGMKVDADGCPISVLGAGAAAWTFSNINFETAKAEIQPSSYSILDEIAVALNANPTLKIVVEGHTDSTGARSFNLDLSQRRAQAVVDYLVIKGVSPRRLSAKGYGPDRPIADNDTRIGRSKNRRVQFTRVE